MPRSRSASRTRRQPTASPSRQREEPRLLSRASSPAAVKRTRTPHRRLPPIAGRPLIASTSEHPPLPLYSFDEAPEWMQHNPFIRHGYRVHYTMRMCVQSLFFLHNETANVWTHIFGFAIFAWLAFHVFTSLLKPVLVHYLIFACFSFGCLCCMALSACYHLFSAHHERSVYARFMTLDYMGITCLIVFSFYPPCYLIFSCQPSMRFVYLGSISTLGLVGILGPMFERFNDDSFKWVRLAIFVALGGSGIIPIVHFCYAVPLNSTTSSMIAGIVLMLFLYACGLIFYIFKIPERWFPGRFDVWLHSHQLWHLFVTAAAMVHFFASMAMYRRWEDISELHC